jgi:hypothetical protein
VGKMSGLNLHNLNKYKYEILKAEIISYFALCEKTNANKGPNKVNQAGIFTIDLENITKSIKISILNRSFEAWDNFLKNPREWRNQKDPNYLLQVLYGIGESLNSGIDKGSPDESAKVKPEDKKWISNAFGSYKKEIIYLSNLLHGINYLIKNIEDKFNMTFNNISFENYSNFRNALYSLFSNLLSDDRYPINDITLWDQAYMATSMFKAVLSNLVLDNSKFQNFQDNPSSIKWRILGIQYDKLGLAEKGFKPAHIDWYRSISEEIDDEIKKLLELKYPIGNEVYRDETGIYFIVGEDLGKDLEDDKANLAILKDDLKEIKEEILKIFKEKSLDEFYPAIFLTKASRGLMNLTYLLENARENFLKADWSKKELDICLEKSLSGRARGICQICKQRLVFESDKRDENKNVCEICYKKTKGRVDKWLNNRTDETIWTAELKDKNDRLALVVMKFELMDWLNGDLLNSLVLQIGINWKDNVDELASELNNIFKMGQDKKVGDTLLKKYTDKALHGLKIKQHNIIESFLLERSIGDKWEEFIYKALGDWDEQNRKPLRNKIDFENRKIEWQNLDDKNINFLSTLLLQFLLRKNPSPARLRRIWESTREFFEKIEKTLLCIANIPNNRRIRIFWERVNDIPASYEEKATSGNLEFWVKNNKVYLITYDYEVIEKKLKGEDLKLKLKLENGQEIELKLQDAKIEYYKPYISIIDPTPISWQFIIPAEYVPELIKNTQNLYDEYFKYVYGKLPLHIGVIIQDYKKPLYVGINALRKIRRDVKERKELWEKIDAKDFKEIFSDKIKKGTIEEQCNKPVEYYSLYFGDLSNGDYKFYINPEKFKLKNANYLQDNEKIKYIPNTFDFEFLDTNTRRNDIYYNEHNHYKRKADLKTNKPYNIEKHFDIFEKFKEAFKEGSSTSKLHSIINIFYERVTKERAIEGNETEYLDDGTKKLTKKFLASVIINTLKPNESKEMKNFIQSWLGFGNKDITHQEIENSVTKEKIKMFIDMFDFWHKALKEV